MIHEYLENRMPAITTICQRYGVKRLYAFGSIVDGRFIKNKSDIDLLVELYPHKTTEEKAKNLFNVWMDLQNIVDCQVDLITPSCIRGKYFKKYLNLYKEVIFDHENPTLRPPGKLPF